MTQPIDYARADTDAFKEKHWRQFVSEILLIPALLSICSFLCGNAWIVTGDNGTQIDLIGGMVGFLLGALAIPAFLVALIVFPYRNATPRLWTVLLLHLVGIGLAGLVGFFWMACHFTR